MGQILINYTGLFVVPITTGVFVRFFFRHMKRAHLVTACFVILAIVTWSVEKTVPSHGSEQYAIMALLATNAAAASLLTGLVIQLKSRN